MTLKLYSITSTHLAASFHDNLANLVTERQTILDFAAARDNGNHTLSPPSRTLRNAKLRSNHRHQHIVPYLVFLVPMTFPLPDQQCQGTEGIRKL